MSETSGIGIIVWVIIGLVVLAGLIFGLVYTMKTLGGTDCTTGLGNCEDEKNIFPLANNIIEINDLGYEVIEVSAL